MIFKRMTVMLNAEFMAKLLTFYIPHKKTRRKIKTAVRNYFYAFKMIRRAKSIGKGFICNAPSYGNHNTQIGDYVCINGVQIIGDGPCKIGSYSQMGHEILIITSNHNYEEGKTIPYDNINIYKEVEIGDFCWIGSRVTILPGAKIGEGAIIQAGSVVHGEIPRCAIAGGNPAKVFKYRNVEHFEKLKNEKSYLIN